MGNFLGLLYERFLFRDIIGKLTPGLIVFITLYYLWARTLIQDFIKNHNFELPVWVIIPISYLIGLLLQISGELLGIHWKCRAPEYILFIPVKHREPFKKHHEKHLNNLIKMSFVKDENIRALNERHIALKEGTGNFALAVLFLYIVGWSTGELDFLKHLLPLVIIFGLGWGSHYIFMTRQIDYQNGVVNEIRKKENSPNMSEASGAGDPGSQIYK